MNKKSGDDLAERLTAFAVNIIAITAKLPKTPAGKHIAYQLLKSGTSPGANYEEARGAESRADFIHKMGIVLKELKESRYWLRLIKSAKLLTGKLLEDTTDECEQLCAIAAKSILTAKKNR